MLSDFCFTGHRLRDVHMRGIQRHRGIELEWDADCQRYLRQNSPLCLSVILHTLSRSHLTPGLIRLHGLLLFFIRAPSVPLTRQNPRQFEGSCWWGALLRCGSCLCNRGRSAFGIQSLWVHPAPRTSTEACGDRSDQEHSHPHLAVQSSWRWGCCHLLHHRGFQVSFNTQKQEYSYLFVW